MWTTQSGQAVHMILVCSTHEKNITTLSHKAKVACKVPLGGMIQQGDMRTLATLKRLATAGYAKGFFV